jgi:hypothetical protein
MENVFIYFVSIGAGISFGLSLGAVPGLLIWRWINKKGGTRYVSNVTKTRS